jgi:Flp pilus assembly pilin Flp
LIIGLIAVICIAALTSIGTNIKGFLEGIATELAK